MNVTLYGIAILKELDKAREKGEVRHAEDVAKALDMALGYVHKVTHLLVVAGLVLSKRGPAGGLEIARPANRIPVTTLLDATDNSLLADVEGDTLLLTAMRAKARTALGNRFRGLTVADLF